MAAETNLGGRRNISESEERQLLRRGLIDRYRADPRYRAIIGQDLSPLWRAAASASSWLGDRPLSFADVLDQLSEGGRKSGFTFNEAVLDRYVRAVVQTVVSSMRLVTEGYAASWALRDVHDDVTGQQRHSRLLSISPRARDDDLAVALDLSPNFIGVRHFAAADAVHRLPDQEFDLTHLGVGYGDEHWGTLETLATTIVGEAIGYMRRAIEARYPARNPTAILGWERDLDALYRVLFHRESPTTTALAARLRKLLARMGIDSPKDRSDGGHPDLSTRANLGAEGSPL